MSALSGESPARDSASLIALVFQRQYLLIQDRPVADSPVETLVARDAQLYLGHKQPISVEWTLVELEGHRNAYHLPGLGGSSQRTKLV